MRYTDYHTNPALLKLALYCEGLRLSQSARGALRKGRGIMRTRAGLGSGLELILPHGLWTNAPVSERFCKQSSFELDYVQGSFAIHHPSCPPIPVQLSPRPTWYDRHCANSRKPMRQIGTLQGTYLGIFPTRVCEFWSKESQENCRYCSLGLNLGADDAPEKTIEEVLEVVRVARAESGITYVDFNTGHHEDESFLDELEPIIARIKEETGLLIGVQTPPHSNLARYDKLRDMGVNRVSFCFELYSPDRFKEVCPGKDRFYGLDRYLKTIDYCAGLSSRNLLEPWVTNGEIIAGLESPEASMAAIDRITSVGAIPTVCVFRPLAGTAYAHLPPPQTEDMIPVFRHLYEACMRHDLPIGLAPNIQVSLVMLPEECAWFSQRYQSGFHYKTMMNGLKKHLFRAGFQHKLRRFDQGTKQEKLCTVEDLT